MSEIEQLREDVLFFSEFILHLRGVGQPIATCYFGDYAKAIEISRRRLLEEVARGHEAPPPACDAPTCHEETAAR